MISKSFENKGLIDIAVIRVFILLIIIASSVFIYKALNYEECPEVDFTVAENDLIVGELVEFTCICKNPKKINWEFGDGSSTEIDISPAHIYNKPGEYIVTLSVNLNCKAIKTILINPKAIKQNLTVIPKFNCPSKVYLGDKVRFRCLNKDAYSYEWNFGETKSINSKSRNPVYIYRKSGKKTIHLTVNGEKKYIASKEIFVMPRPARKQAPAKVTAPPKTEPIQAPKPEPQVEKPKPNPIISNSELQQMIVSFAKGKVAKDAFNIYLYDSPDKVIVEINNKIIRFSDFLRYIQGQDLSIKEFVTYRESDKRISRIKIKLRRFK